MTAGEKTEKVSAGTILATGAACAILVFFVCTVFVIFVDSQAPGVDWKAISTMVAAVVVGGFAFLTAYWLTPKLERERMGFQRESEAQKQRMEMFKTLYQERMAASKKLIELTDDLYHTLLWDFENNSIPPAEVTEKLRVCLQHNNANGWIFTDEVKEKFDGFLGGATFYVNYTQGQALRLPVSTPVARLNESYIGSTVV